LRVFSSRLSLPVSFIILDIPSRRLVAVRLDGEDAAVAVAATTMLPTSSSNNYNKPEHQTTTTKEKKQTTQTSKQPDFQ
jgi:hypothetical protein